MAQGAVTIDHAFVIGQGEAGVVGSENGNEERQMHIYCHSLCWETGRRYMLAGCYSSKLTHSYMLILPFQCWDN